MTPIIWAITRVTMLRGEDQEQGDLERKEEGKLNKVRKLNLRLGQQKEESLVIV